MSDNTPVVCLFGHSFVKRLGHCSGRRGELFAPTLGLQSCCQVVAYGEGGLSFKRVLDTPDRYLSEIGRRHPDLLVGDFGCGERRNTTNDAMTGRYCFKVDTAAEVPPCKGFYV